MSYNTGQPPTPYSESTAIEVRRAEGTVKTFVTGAGVGTVSAGSIMKLTNSGALQTVGTEDPSAIVGVALYQAVSGARVTVAKGQLRAYWDGVGTVTPGVEIGLSTTYSGWFTAFLSGPAYSVGRYEPLPGGGTLTASNSGTLQVVSIP